MFAIGFQNARATMGDAIGMPDALPWWLDEAPPDPETAPLDGEAEADVAVVGGGYTGLWTALELKRREPGLRVTVLEAEIVGFGPSGRNGGFLETYWCALPRLRSRLGDEAALALARASEGALDAVRGLGEDVWLREAGMLEVSAAPGQDEAVETAVRVAGELGVPERAVPLDAAEVAERCRSPVFRRGVWFPDAATVQPARLVRALRRAALAAGVELHERSRATSIRPGLVEVAGGQATRCYKLPKRLRYGVSEPSNTVLQAGGRLRAPEVVVATNAWLTGWRPVRGRLTNFGSYVVLTEPVSELLAEIGWTGGEGIADGRMFLHYFRTTSDGRVLMGSGSGPVGPGGAVGSRFFEDEATVARAERGLRRLLPALAEARVEHAWGGPIDVSGDHLPFFGTVPGARIHYGAGYSGNGVGPSWLGGQILASLVLGADDEWSRLPLVTRRSRRFPPEPVRFLGGAAVRRAIMAVEEADEEGRRANLLARGVSALPRLLGLRIGTR
jgi:glycine/D-amino acid oxidase-like deaminating enzyme